MLKLKNIYKTFNPQLSFTQEFISIFKNKNKNIHPGQKLGVKAIRGINLDIYENEVLGLVGESGSGKSTLGRICAGLYQPDKFEETKILYNGEDYRSLEKIVWAKSVQMMFQDSVSALNPRLTAFETLAEPLKIHKMGNKDKRKERILSLLVDVGLSADLANRYPHEFSGGQRQRLNLARSLALEPKILIADEPVSALDVSIQAQIINLLLDLKKKYNLTLIFISHDLPLVRLIADRVAVMYSGLIMEICQREAIGNVKHHPYVLSLWQAAESLGDLNYSNILKGEVPDPSNPPKACPFHLRCPEAEKICSLEKPILKNISPALTLACHKR